MLPSSFKLYSAVVLSRFRSNLKSFRAISNQRPRYLSLSKGLTAVAPLGMEAHENNPVIRRPAATRFTDCANFIIGVRLAFTSCSTAWLQVRHAAGPVCAFGGWGGYSKKEYCLLLHSSRPYDSKRQPR